MRKLFLGLAVAILACGPALRASADAGDDRAAAQAIAQNMKESGQLKDYRVGVKFQNGVAWLLGTVTSAEQKAIAEDIARNTEGVDAIVSKLEIAGGAQAEATSDRATKPTKKLAARSASEPVAQASLEQPVQPLQRLQQPRSNMPVPYARTMQGQVQPAHYGGQFGGGMAPMPMSHVPSQGGQTVSYDNPQLPGYAWPSYAAYPNYAAVTYPQQYSPSAWPYIGPFYPYPQVPLGWRKVTLEWDDGWWFLDFDDCKDCH